MISLIINEYTKLFKKKSTWIWLIIVVVLSVGFIGAIKIFQNVVDNNDYYNDYYYTKERYEEEIEYYKGNKNIGYEIEVEYYESLIEYEVYEYNWKMDALDEAYRVCRCNVFFAEDNGLSEAEKEKNNNYYLKLIDAVKNDNYILYLEYKKEVTGTVSYTFDKADKAIDIYTYMIDNKIEPDFESEIYNVLCKIKEYQDNMESYSSDVSMIKEYNNYKEKWLIELYRLDNDLVDKVTNSRDINDVMMMSNNVWKYFKLSEYMIILESLLMVVIAGGIVASEYSQGTIKFLLINPKSRTKILFSKLITVISFSVMTLIGLFVINGIASMLIGGFEGIDAMYLVVDNDTVKAYPAIVLLIKEYAISMIEVIVTATMAFAISSLLKKSSMATGVGVACLVGGSTITTMLAAFNLDWGRYLIFANIDLLSISEGGSLFVNHSLIGAVINIVIHMIVFILTAHDAFVRREI